MGQKMFSHQGKGKMSLGEYMKYQRRMSVSKRKEQAEQKRVEQSGIKNIVPDVPEIKLIDVIPSMNMEGIADMCAGLGTNLAQLIQEEEVK